MTVAAGPRSPMQVSAHRGDSGRFRENTLPAIRSAIAHGADYVEIDVRLTSDRSVVVLHDPTLERLWQRPQAIERTTAAEVRALGDEDHRPPLLAEVLALFEDTSSTLLIDMEDGAFAELAFRVTRRFSARVAWCGDLDGMRIIRSLDASARVWLPWDSVVPPSVADLAELRPERVNSDVLVITRDLVERVHSLGCRVTAWTVDDEFTMRWARDIGVDTLTTNRLSLLQEVLVGADGKKSVEQDDRAEQDGAEHPDAGIVDLDRALAVARGLAQWAIAFASNSDPGEISTKLDAADLVTDVDVAVERHVREVIGQAFPLHGFVGEEMGGAADPGVPCWYLDPIDGTTNFANRVPWNAFSLALVVDGAPVVGVVADPWRGDLFEAVAGGGARLGGIRLTLPECRAGGDPLRGKVVSTELASHLPWPGMLELLDRLGRRFCTLRIMGCGTLTLVGIAAGRGVGAVIGEFGAVDHLAAALIVREAGGVVLDSVGEPALFPSAGGILAAAPDAAAELHALWRESCAVAAAT